MKFTLPISPGCLVDMAQAFNGVERGFCSRPLGHSGIHSNATCPKCGVRKTPHTSAPSRISLNGQACRNCNTVDARHRAGGQPQTRQIPGQQFTFACGCAGILPTRRGVSTVFAFWNSDYWYCRVAHILRSSQQAAKTRGYLPIDFAIPHASIRRLMLATHCVQCGEPLHWIFRAGKTPHLHHNHETGKIYGFTHPVCNTQALDRTIDRLHDQLYLFTGRMS